ncbi:fatty acid desaturase family protein [Gordonia rubripertincta]|uniref:Acyl-CoA desaturase n=1 Tax=Gordonia rubripertincta TaxID=36822 RepID=A0ABT4N3F0_GORRU|nr:acyl-CoA desaturase [Gordonia rubripertincta]MCZ4552472.1 acyl-CoA desaturase [Gordonia rubripertincta]
MDATRNDQVRLYADLLSEVKALGLLERRVGWYAGRLALLLGAFVATFAVVFALGSTWWQLAIAPVFGILFTQTAFLSHDSAHKQVFASGKANEWAARLIGNLIVGLGYGWWQGKHSKHHANPNKIGKDGDIATGALMFVPEDFEDTGGLKGWIRAHQGWLFFPMLTLEGVNLHFESLKVLFDGTRPSRRRLELTLLSIRLIGFPVLVFSAMGWGVGAVFLIIQSVVFGLYMGASFAPNHKGMPIVPKDVRVNFFERQVRTSRNVRGGRAMDWAMGGLNLQIEHHLFPSMPSASLRQARPLVIRYCLENDVPYTEAGLIESYGIVIKYLNRVGMGFADPFDCPFVAAYR